MYIYYFSNYVYKLYWTNNYSVQSDTKYFQPLKGTLKYFYLLFVIIYYTSRAKTQMFRNTTSKPPIGKMMTFPRSRRKAGIRKSNITLSVDINIRFEFMPPGSTVCIGQSAICLPAVQCSSIATTTDERDLLSAQRHVLWNIRVEPLVSFIQLSTET